MTVRPIYGPNVSVAGGSAASRRKAQPPAAWPDRVMASPGARQAARPAPFHMVVDHAGRLHERVESGRPDKPEAARLKRRAHRRGLRRHGGQSPKLPGRCAARWARTPEQLVEARRGIPNEVVRHRAFEMVASTLARLRMMPGSCMRAPPPRRPTRRRVDIEAGEGGAEGAAVAGKIVIQDSRPGIPRGCVSRRAAGRRAVRPSTPVVVTAGIPASLDPTSSGGCRLPRARRPALLGHDLSPSRGVHYALVVE